MGLGLHNYHDTFLYFPSAGGNQASTAGLFPYAGPSQWVGILPYMDLANLYNQFDFSTVTSISTNGAGTQQTDIFFNLPKNIQAASNANLPWINCPSSTLGNNANDGLTAYIQSGTAMNVQCSQYHGIAGACPYGNFTDSTSMNPITVIGGALTIGGCGSNRGMIPDYFNMNIRDCTDGTSNTMIVGEISAPIFDQFDQNNVAHDRRPGGNFAWFMGSWNGTGLGNPAGANMTQGPNYSNVTLRYPPNARTTITGSTWSLQGCGSDPGTLETDADRSNCPLTSFHSGGVQVLLTDGTVRFISSNIDLYTYTILGVRNDGLVLGAF
jgi:hypothetical protein